MNVKLIIQLSLFGLAMGIATVFIIPSNIEWLFWIIIFMICAFLIARSAPGKYFLHGFLTSLANCVWITGIHILLFDMYAINHPEEISMIRQDPFFADHMRLMMLITGPLIGIVSGLVLGLFSFIAAKLMKKN